jgi:cytochrome P450/NADPH-cytochrome P450 reductase
VVGILPHIDLASPLFSLIELLQPYGPIVQFSIGGELNIFVHSVELMNELCDESRFHKDIKQELEKLRHIVHDGLFTARNGEPNWAIARGILTPIFGTIKIREMFPGMRDVAEQLCLKWFAFPLQRPLVSRCLR